MCVYVCVRVCVYVCVCVRGASYNLRAITHTYTHCHFCHSVWATKKGTTLVKNIRPHFFSLMLFNN
jgi:hypothetical protein